MQIVMLLAPTVKDVLYTGIAVSKHGRRYLFNATPEGDSRSVLRQDLRGELPGGRCIWWHIKPPPALRMAVRSAIRKSRH
jgi:hypothetical protein